MKTVIDVNNLDWNRSKKVEIMGRGNLSLVAPVWMSKKGDKMVVATPAKCVWPNSFLTSNSKFLSRRVYGKVSV